MGRDDCLKKQFLQHHIHALIQSLIPHFKTFFVSRIAIKAYGSVFVAINGFARRHAFHPTKQSAIIV